MTMQCNTAHRGPNIIMKVLRQFVADTLLRDQLRFIRTELPDKFFLPGNKLFLTSEIL